MRKLTVFNNVSLDGYFVDRHGDMSWARKEDPEWLSFASGNASGGGDLVFGRVTYQMMASFWPTPMAMQMMPAVAEGMNRARKFVFSRTLETADWNNTRVLKGDPAAEMRALKEEPGSGLTILGSGSIVAQLAQAGLVDEFQIALIPIVLGAGRTMFEGLAPNLNLKLVESRSFGNGNVVLRYCLTHKGGGR
jgi:dihydrofolate reductase